jgi:hypothetical protein
VPLVLHVGLPKTGTTSLQSVLENLPNNHVFAPSGSTAPEHSFWRVDLAERMKPQASIVKKYIYSAETTFVVSPEVLTWPQGSWNFIPPRARIKKSWTYLIRSVTEQELFVAFDPRQTGWRRTSLSCLHTQTSVHL